MRPRTGATCHTNHQFFKGKNSHFMLENHVFYWRILNCKCINARQDGPDRRGIDAVGKRELEDVAVAVRRGVREAAGVDQGGAVVNEGRRNLLAPGDGGAGKLLPGPSVRGWRWRERRGRRAAERGAGT